VKTNAFNDDPDAFVVFVEDSNANPGLPIYVSISTSGDTATLVQCNPESNGAFRSGPLALIYGDTDNQFAAYNIPNNEVDDRTHSVFPGGMLTVEYEPDNSPVVTISSDIPLVNTITYDVIILEYPPGTPCVESGTTSQHEIYAEERFAQCEVSIIRMQQDCHPCPDDVDLADGLSSQEYTVLGNHFRGPEYCYTSQIQIFYVNYFTENPDYGGIARTNEDLIAISSVQAVQSTTTHELAHVTSGYGDMGILTYLVLCQNSNRPPNLEEWEFRCRFLQAHENAIKSYQGNRE